MICDPLAYTGSGVQLGPLLILAIACLLAGGLLLLMSRRRGRAVTAALLLLVTGVAAAITTASPPAMADECPPVGDSSGAVYPADNYPADNYPADNYPADNYPADNYLTIVQNSVMAGMAPGIAPVAITGIVSNNGPDSTYIYSVAVEITGVSTVPGSAPGVCDPSDYLLLNPRMPVGQPLDPGGSTTFSGASIGFSNKLINQDACKSATVLLRYTANTS